MHAQLQVFLFKLNIIWDMYPQMRWAELWPPVQHQGGAAVSARPPHGRENPRGEPRACPWPIARRRL